MSARKELFELDIPGDDKDLPEVQGDMAPKSSGTETLPPGTVVFSMEQLTLLAVAVLILVVVAFLVGSYVSGRVEQPASQLPGPAVKVVETPENLLPDEHGEPPLPQVYDKPLPKPDDTNAAAPADGEGKYTLEVIRFNLEDRATAMATVEKLQKYGYAPAFIETQGNEISVCVGRFPDKNDKKALQWREEIRNLRPAYRHCDFITVKSKG